VLHCVHADLIGLVVAPGGRNWFALLFLLVVAFLFCFGRAFLAGNIVTFLFWDVSAILFALVADLDFLIGTRVGVFAGGNTFGDVATSISGIAILADLLIDGGAGFSVFASRVTT